MEHKIVAAKTKVIGNAAFSIRKGKLDYKVLRWLQTIRASQKSFVSSAELQQ